MSNWLLLHVPLAVFFVLAVVGVPLWVTFRHPEPVVQPATRRVAPARPEDRYDEEERLAA